MTRHDDDAASGLLSDEPVKPARTWTWPRHLGRMRTSTLLLILGFLAAALLRGYFMQGEPQVTPETGEVVAPTQATTQPVPQRTTTPPHPTTGATSTPSPSSPATAPETAGATATPTTSPLIVLPPGLIPSGVELPPGVAVETTTAPTPTTP